MEILVFRALLLIVLFVLLTGDYTTYFSHIIQPGREQTNGDTSRKASKSYEDDEDADGKQIEDTLEMYCEYLI
jgi:hypothetical protein